jgi:NitT/TauT family transport system permease protein
VSAPAAASPPATSGQRLRPGEAAPAAARGAAAPRRKPLLAMKPLTPVSHGMRVGLGISFFVLFVAVWAAATFGGFVQKTFLADPLAMLKSGWVLLTEMGFAKDIGMTMFRVLGGFLIAAVIAVPLGVAMGAYKPIEAFFEPFVSFARYLPASAFIPLLILWAGIGEAQKLSVIFLGSFFSLVLMISVTVGNTRRDLVEAAYTLGVKDASLIRRVLIPGAAPEIAEQLRMVLGWAWTYVIVAELIGASSGIGHMITDSQALLATDQIIFGIIVIGLIGLASDLLFKWANRRLFPWAQLGR